MITLQIGMFEKWMNGETNLDLGPSLAECGVGPEAEVAETSRRSGRSWPWSERRMSSTQTPWGRSSISSILHQRWELEVGEPVDGGGDLGGSRLPQTSSESKPDPRRSGRWTWRMEAWGGWAPTSGDAGAAARALEEWEFRAFSFGELRALDGVALRVTLMVLFLTRVMSMVGLWLNTIEQDILFLRAASYSACICIYRFMSTYFILQGIISIVSIDKI
jgi:hypothetical protein